MIHNKFFSLLVLCATLAAPSSHAAGKETPEQQFKKIQKITESAVGNGDSYTFEFDKKHFTMASEIREFKKFFKNTGCNFTLSVGRTINIEKLKNDLYTGDTEATKAAATVLEKMRKKNQLLTVLQAEWDGEESDTASSESCSISIYRFYGVDGSGFNLELNATD